MCYCMIIIYCKTQPIKYKDFTHFAHITPANGRICSVFLQQGNEKVLFIGLLGFFCFRMSFEFIIGIQTDLIKVSEKECELIFADKNCHME